MILFSFLFSARADTPIFDDRQLALVRQMSHRDGAPPCSDLPNSEGLLHTDLLLIVKEVTQPPWVGMRAAGCVIELFPQESQTTFESWMRSEQTMGLAYLLTAKISTLPESVALDIGRIGLAGPHAEGVKSRLQSQNGPIIEQLLQLESQ